MIESSSMWLAWVRDILNLKAPVIKPSYFMLSAGTAKGAKKWQ